MSDKIIKNILIVGGGTAGWMTALYAKQALPESNITLVESEEIGILGAGEGTTPHFINFLDFLDIPISRLIKSAKATIKNGIKFTNWNNDGEHYYHSFESFDGISLRSANFSSYLSKTNAGMLHNICSKDSLSDFDFLNKISEKNKVPLLHNKNNIYDVGDLIFCFDQLGSFGIHFDARLTAKLFSEIAIERGVVRIEGKVVDITFDHRDDISNIILDSGISLEPDFVFDASGFHKVIIGKKYKSVWKSHSKKLPVNAAVPFFIEQDKENIPPYTESIAMKYGWMWKIPVQDRYGCGYVYDSSLISEKEAIEEIEDYLGFEPTYPRKDKGGFKFNAGYYETPWTNNCVAVGLSAGFIEPLEATSLWTTIVTLTNTFEDLDLMFNRNQKYIDDFNSKYSKMTEEIVDFIYFHYMSDRKDTLFWEKFSSINAPDGLKELLEKWDYKSPAYQDYVSRNFGLESWIAVALGVNKLNTDVIKRYYEINQLSEKIKDKYNTIKNTQDDLAVMCVDHKDFLKFLKGELSVEK
jgi:tryptophan 7-halogenase